MCDTVSEFPAASPQGINTRCQFCNAAVGDCNLSFRQFKICQLTFRFLDTDIELPACTVLSVSVLGLLLPDILRGRTACRKLLSREQTQRHKAEYQQFLQH